MSFCHINKKLDKEKYILYNYKTVRSKAMKRILHFYIIYVMRITFSSADFFLTKFFRMLILIIIL